MEAANPILADRSCSGPDPPERMMASGHENRERPGPILASNFFGVCDIAAALLKS